MSLHFTGNHSIGATEREMKIKAEWWEWAIEHMLVQWRYACQERNYFLIRYFYIRPMHLFNRNGCISVTTDCMEFYKDCSNVFQINLSGVGASKFLTQSSWGSSVIETKIRCDDEAINRKRRKQFPNESIYKHSNCLRSFSTAINSQPGRSWLWTGAWR